MKGFTLVELMITIVIVVISILVVVGAVFIVPTVSDVYSDHKRANCMDSTDNNENFRRCMGEAD